MNRRRFCPEQLEARTITSSSHSGSGDAELLVGKVTGEEAVEAVRAGASSASWACSIWQLKLAKCNCMADAFTC